MIRKSCGQILVGAVVALAILALLIPALVSYIQRETQWTTKAQRSTRAFQLAESGLDRAYQQLVLSTTTLSTIEGGGTQANYNFDHKYSDLSGGDYEVKLAGDPVTLTITVTAVGRDSTASEIRALKATYASPGAYPAAIYAINSASIQGNPTVEWGPVASPGPIITDSSHIYPRYYSGGLISPFDTNAGSPPNTDNVQWWSYYSLTTPSAIDLPAYKAAAGASCTDQSGCLGSGCHVCYYTAANYPTYDPGTNHSFYNGADTALIVEGNLSLHGNYGNGSETGTPISSVAWKEYGENATSWSHYVTNFDPSAPATYAAAVASNYAPVGLHNPGTINKLFIHGFLYIGGTVSISGGGNGSIIGSMYVATVADLGSSHVTVYYDNTVISNIKTTNSTLSRTSWQEMSNCSWPIGSANATCP